MNSFNPLMFESSRLCLKLVMVTKLIYSDGSCKKQVFIIFNCSGSNLSISMGTLSILDIVTLGLDVESLGPRVALLSS